MRWNVEDRIFELVEKVEALSAKMAPEAWKLALEAVRIQAIAVVLAAAISLVVSMYLSYWIDNNKRWEDVDSYDRNAFKVIVYSICGALVINCWVFFLDTDSWIAILYPEVSVALSILGR